MEVKRDILWRVYLSYIGIIVLGLLVLGRAFYIQRFQGSYWRSMSDSLHQRFISLTAERGSIYSEDGQMLSTSIPTFDIYVDFNADGLREKKGRRFKENVDSFANSLADYFRDKKASQYKKELVAAYNRNERYYPLKKKLSFEQYRTFREFPLVKLGRNKSGVIVEVNSKRMSPFGLLANRTIGLSREHIASNGKIKKQNVGLEKTYDSLLSGIDGQKLVRFVAGGTAIPVEGTLSEPINGKDIFTTIDVNMQDIAQNALMKMMLQSEAQFGTAIVMETKTGKIKAIANLGQRPDGSYWEDDNYALRVTEPGSTIKLATLLSVLENGTSTLDDQVEVGSAGRMEVGPRIVNDAERSPKPVLSVKECFSHSSNVGMSKLALKGFGGNPVEFRKFLHRFHLDEPAAIDLSNIPSPRLAPLEKKNGGLMNMLTMSFGYAIQVSALHTLTLYNAVANDGRMMKPYLVSSIRKDGIPVRVFEPIALNENICKPSVIQAAKQCMEAVVIEGTGKHAFKDMPFAVAGKTGTAHVADGKIKYQHYVYQASFAGYFPADDPQYTCIVLIRTKPHAALHYGGQLAAPVFREIATKLYAMYVDKKPLEMIAAAPQAQPYFYGADINDIKPVFSALNMSVPDSMVRQRVVTVAKGKMPDVKGMGLKDALYLLEKLGMKVNVRGIGRIISQSIPAGSAIENGLTVMLELS